MYCDHCGTSIDSTSQFCGRCGRRIDGKAIARELPSVSVAKRRSSPKLPIIIIVLLIPLAFVAFFLFPLLSADEISETRKILSQAAQSAEAIEDPLSKALTLNEIGQVQVDANDRFSALITLGKARQAARQAALEIKDDTTFAEIAASQAYAGDKASAEIAIKELLQLTLTGSAGSKANATIHMAFIQAAMGDIPGALARLDGLRGSFDSYIGLRFLTGQLLRWRKTPEALQVAKRIDDRVWKSDALNLIAIAQTKKGDRQGAMVTFQQALQAVDGLSDDPGKASLLLNIAAAQGEARDHTSALLTIQLAIKTGAEFREDRQKRELAVAYANSGEMQKALTIISTIGKVDEKDIVLASIAVMQAQGGNVKEALQTASKLASAHWQENAFRGIAAAQANAGNVKAAIEWASKRTSLFSKANALLGVAEGILERKLARPSKRVTSIIP